MDIIGIEVMGMDVTLIALCVLAGALVIAIIAFIMVIVLSSKLKKQRLRIDAFMKGAEGLDIETSLNDKFERLEIVEAKQNNAEKDIKKIFKTLEGTYQKLGIVKYDAYSENGGRLSFALSMLDEKNDGFVMNVMTGSDGSYCYVKAVEGGECKIKLGSEEARALQKAVNGEK